MTPDDPRHGRNSGAAAHRAAGEKPCDRCLLGAARYDNTLRLERMNGITSRKVPALGTRRRLQALVAIGWDLHTLATRAGVSVDRLSRIARGRNPVVFRSTAARIASLYDGHHMQPPPPGRAANYARSIAAKNGYAPPLAWDDIDTDPAPIGVRHRELVQRHDHHTWEDHDELRAQGYTRAQIAHRLGMTVDALEKALARRRKEDAA